MADTGYLLGVLLKGTGVSPEHICARQKMLPVQEAQPAGGRASGPLLCRQGSLSSSITRKELMLDVTIKCADTALQL